MKNIVAGTAGHIDHGKTALVRALTGIDTDRLEEEKRRGISIDIGFAHAQLSPELRIAFIDVPGHERFIKNMLAGVGGIDLVILVIAADESVKPQTREHFDICRLLGISSGLVALTKSDLVPVDILALVRLEMEDFLAGSFLEGAPVVAVSSLTGEGLPELRAELAALADKIPARRHDRAARMPIDRSFAMKGFGTVVTGTLLEGRIGLEQEVEILPGGRRARVRGLQVHGQPAGFAAAGQRAAVNLAGVDHTDLRRGMVLAEPGAHRVTETVDCELTLLPSAKPLAHGAPVHFHSGTAEVEAQVRLLAGDRVEPGARACLRLLLREPLLLVAGDRFILRMFSPVTTIAGGRILDAHPPAIRRRAALAARLRVLAENDLTETVKLLVSEARHGIALAEAARRTGVTAEELRRAVPADEIEIVALSEPWLVSRQWMQDRQAVWRERLARFHKEKPLLPGMAREEMRSRDLPEAPPGLFETLLARDPALALEGETVRLASHKLALKQDEYEAVAKIESAFERAGLAVPSLAEVLAGSGVEPARARSLLQILIRDRKLVRVAEDLVYHARALAALRESIKSHKGQRFTVGTFKEWTGISRKYAIPLLEYLDRERVTRREGDTRVVN